MAQLYGFPLLFLFLGGVGVVFLAHEIGWQLGKRNEGKGVSNHLAALEQVLLGMVALMVGFSFLMALTRFDARREATVNLANAIGTTALRARLLPEPTRTETLKLLRENAEMRTALSTSEKARTVLLARTNEIQEKLWEHAKTLSANDKEMVPTGLFIQSLNEMIDNQAKRLAELRNQIPEEIMAALFAICAISCGFAGYANRLDPLRSRWPSLTTATLVSAVIFLIIDLDSPRAGFLKEDVRPMVDLVAGMPVIPD
ncbi:hypothetical protein JQ604_17275 [Bradyrhizobium jicamae]|uniref:bestrophin-like domain n=1 Tax=Bradyrhizobium jicamae TaxID=280332 RepID=UPI001BA9551E|nr:hypothetical protein [Bradyrhizobium jicamae]MBR0753938.1 hypothetical protein [Bradyrhizobium jicamae]